MKVVTEKIFDPGNTKFRTLLRAFDKIIENDPKPETVKAILADLKTRAAGTSDLTSRQVEAIAARCDNYMKGEYGKTKKPEHFDHGKPSEK